ncbi:ABC transporter ATP-binding protein [Leptotrichia sp. oral taxon 879]|uniref:ABC transporter ATP-binding protein n=1 Tax=Leptotrichia sp. oral taxon 879 TaxID=1227267 RepID=UPI0003ADFCE1|nr:ABC transporter ATP-binding protein [Leptotrichia sp. oral taxon 879]ERK53386.1 ABC transporter, ATP-binding protein [Leptotrichia sp. oral taxon 879 str. F0557]
MLKKLFSRLGEYKKSALISPIFIGIEVVFEMLIPTLMAVIIDSGLNGNDGKGDMKFIVIMGLATFGVAMLSLLCGIQASKYASYASAGFAKNLRKDLFSKIQSFSFTNIDKFSTAGLITRFTTDVNNIQNSFQMLIRGFVRAPLMMCVAIFMSFMISPKLSMIFIVAVLFLGSFLVFVIFKVHPIFTAAIKKYDDINSSLQENINGIRVVKAYIREKYETNKFKKATENLRNMLLKGERIIIFVSPVMQITVFGCILLLSWFGAKMIVVNELTTGQLTSLFAYTTNILMSLLMLAMMLVNIVFSRASGDRIVMVLDEEPNIKNPENGITEVKDGSIVFKNVDFSYSNNPDVLNLTKINLEIKSGETIGIIGGTGSAKSALVQLIPRLYDVLDGELLVGGVNVKDYDIKTLRDNVAMVLQKNVLFSGTIKDNLRWGNENATDEEMEHACKLAQADEFIQKFPKKYDTRIERGGANVSGGQRQRLCIARALLKSPKILILDDSTSAVDTKTDKLIREAFKNELPHITKIIIGQRVSSIKDSDKILVLEDGIITAAGTHDELLKTSKVYREVYESQTEGSDK